MNTLRQPRWLETDSTATVPSSAERLPRFDVLRGTPIFRAPSLPSIPQPGHDLPFPVRFRFGRRSHA